MSIHISDDPVRELATRLLEVLSSKPQPTLAVSGGSTPRALFDLISAEYANAIDWSVVRLFQVDERCVPPDHDDSNWKMVNTHLLRNIPELRAFRMKAEHPEGDTGYERVIKTELEQAPFDVVLLGMGDDGHTASLFPDTDGLAVNNRLVIFNDVPQLATRRLTMTYPCINTAHHRWFLTMGANKHSAFAEVQAGNLPSAKIRDPEWFVNPDVVGTP